MVPGRATLLKTLDAKKSQVGDTFQAKLNGSVHLKNGPELPSGTLLTGSIERDDTQQGGMSRLAIRLTSATLKAGPSIPIKATIVGVYRPDSNESGAYSGAGDGGGSIPSSWNDGTLAVNQLNVLSDTDLHSRIASRNSGVFVSVKKDNITLRSGSQLQLAIAASQGGNGEDTAVVNSTAAVTQ